MNDTVRFEINNHNIAFLTLNRPEVFNAFDDHIILKLISYLETIKNDASIRALVLQASGKAFSAGADLNWMKSMKGASFDKNVADANELAKLMFWLYNLEIPTIAKVQGAAFGGGVGLAACCDVVIASENASFCLSEVKLGIAPAVISPFVVRAIGVQQAKRFMLTAEKFDAHTAQRIGLVHEVVTVGELEQAVNSLLDTIQNNGPHAVKATKALIKRVAHGEINLSMMDYTTDLIARLRVSDEGQEGLGAFFGKRKPNWIR